MIRQTCIGFLLLILGSILAPARAGSVVSYALGEGVALRFETDGRLVLVVTDPAGDETSLLTCRWPEPAERRLAPAPVFTGEAREGDPGGRRGFTRDADDDRDGATDEDPLDGRDNDGDGLVDEDFAAVSHAMTVWDRARPGRQRHIEVYHWTYPQLTSLVAAVFSRQSGGPVEPLELVLEIPAGWRQIDVAGSSADGGPQAPMFLARTAPGPGPANDLWFGVALLDTDSRRHSGERVRAGDDRLTVPLLSGRQELALAAGPTRLQVVDDLRAAIRLQAGAADPVSGQRVPWLPTAVRTGIPDANLPIASLRAGSTGDIALVLEVESDQVRRFDPDLFRLDGVALGAPDQLIWRGADGGEVRLPWPPPSSSAAGPDPYESLDATGAGTMEFVFDAGEPSGAVLSVVHADGRRASLPVVMTASADSIPADTETAEAAESSHVLQLSPQLLTNYPNPFRTTTRVTFEVPATVGEAFVQDEDTTRDPQLRMPYAGGSAEVSVTVYSLEGREVASLFSGSVGVGTYEAQWNGKDRQGRTVASGAYFCKLQIEEWTTSKRLIFVR